MSQRSSKEERQGNSETSQSSIKNFSLGKPDKRGGNLDHFTLLRNRRRKVRAGRATARARPEEKGNPGTLISRQASNHGDCDGLGDQKSNWNGHGSNNLRPGKNTQP